MRHVQLILGPAGTGKSTYCKYMSEAAEVMKRRIHVVNLDPAAEHFDYEVAIDIRDLISLDDAVEEMNYGPNGGLIFCMEFLNANINWLQEEMDEYGDDCYFLFDCPGQIELFTHFTMMRSLADSLQMWGFRVASVYLMDATFSADAGKFISGALAALSTMVQLELPHFNVLTKCDLVDPSVYEEYLSPDGVVIADKLNKKTSKRFQMLNAAIGSLLDDFQLVSFIPMNINDEDSMKGVLDQIDQTIQYGEDIEPKDLVDLEEREIEGME